MGWGAENLGEKKKGLARVLGFNIKRNDKTFLNKQY